MTPDSSMTLLSLPDVVLQKILRYFSFDQNASLRLICQKFNEFNKSILNNGFVDVQKYQVEYLRKIKSLLPRRESERKRHPLARQSDILTAIETRLSLLNMTYHSYIESNMCCFIPGKVLDEIYRVMHYIKNQETSLSTDNPLTVHVVLTELRDISSMAMEHFEEKIVPVLKENASKSATTPLLRQPSLFSASQSFLELPRNLFGTPPSHIDPDIHVVPEYVERLETAVHTYKRDVNLMKFDLSNVRLKLIEAKRKFYEQERVLLEQSRIITEQTSRLAEQESKISEVTKRLLDIEHAIFSGNPGCLSDLKGKLEQLPHNSSLNIVKLLEEDRSLRNLIFSSKKLLAGQERAFLDSVSSPPDAVSESFCLLKSFVKVEAGVKAEEESSVDRMPEAGPSRSIQVASLKRKLNASSPDEPVAKRNPS